jgi:hypothetical protein
MPELPELFQPSDTVRAGAYPPELLAACRLAGQVLGVEPFPEILLAWTIKHDQVILILHDGRKFIYPITGEWSWYKPLPPPRPAQSDSGKLAGRPPKPKK